ncbi:latent-transforming growth factor beta-binding protein 2-like [Spea bombifrons]|uniref:latent-transforming growth factor beta-binding protein 2-like n=1 Tax=Spea bombifrons TaxID=233779 RepID=UPI00234BD622|nr:latent-transforming growth factor beta-binding protein 2-like [Spea bombifrons]
MLVPVSLLLCVVGAVNMGGSQPVAPGEAGKLGAKNPVTAPGVQQRTRNWQTGSPGIRQAPADSPRAPERKIQPKKLEKGRKVHKMSPNLCGEQCCAGWTVAPKTGACTRAVCSPRCKNGGVCRRPQTCLCKGGFEGPRCETRNASAPAHARTQERALNATSPPPGPCAGCEADHQKSNALHSMESPAVSVIMPAVSPKEPMTNTRAPPAKLRQRNPKTQIHSPNSTTSLSWHSLTLKELQSILQRKGLASKGKMASILTRHLEAQMKQMAREGQKINLIGNTPNTPNKASAIHSNQSGE